MARRSRTEAEIVSAVQNTADLYKQRVRATRSDLQDAVNGVTTETKQEAGRNIVTGSVAVGILIGAASAIARTAGAAGEPTAMIAGGARAVYGEYADYRKNHSSLAYMATLRPLEEVRGEKFFSRKKFSAIGREINLAAGRTVGRLGMGIIDAKDWNLRGIDQRAQLEQILAGVKRERGFWESVDDLVGNRWDVNNFPTFLRRWGSGSLEDKATLMAELTYAIGRSRLMGYHKYINENNPAFDGSWNASDIAQVIDERYELLLDRSAAAIAELAHRDAQSAVVADRLARIVERSQLSKAEENFVKGAFFTGVFTAGAVKGLIGYGAGRAVLNVVKGALGVAGDLGGAIGKTFDQWRHDLGKAIGIVHDQAPSTPPAVKVFQNPWGNEPRINEHQPSEWRPYDRPPVGPNVVTQAPTPEPPKVVVPQVEVPPPQPPVDVDHSKDVIERFQMHYGSNELTADDAIAHDVGTHIHTDFLGDHLSIDKMGAFTEKASEYAHTPEGGEWNRFFHDSVHIAASHQAFSLDHGDGFRAMMEVSQLDISDSDKAMWLFKASQGDSFAISKLLEHWKYIDPQKLKALVEAAKTDPALAKKLLDFAHWRPPTDGYTDGQGLPVTFEMLQSLLIAS